MRHLGKFDHEDEREAFESLVMERLKADPEDLEVLAARLAWIEDDETLEDEAKLAERLGRFGTVLAVTLRREAGRAPWALLTYADPSEAER